MTAAHAVEDGDAEALLLALEVAAGCRAVDGVRRDAGRVLGRRAVLLGGVGRRRRRPTNRTSIAAKIAQPWRRLPTMRPKVARQRRRDQQDRSSISTKFESAVGFSNGIAELTLKKPPPLVPSCLIAILRGDRAERERLLAAGERS